MAKRQSFASGESIRSRRVRCAIYTRKSTEEGLEQEFNSLDAQREACAAYVTSQRHEGWSLVPEHYDDGGFSGGNMDRPGLKRLLADIESGKVDVIVVYKVDRLTRSLADFAKIVEVLDGRGASFVSVTQSFNTTTSMGRLTLNVLLSFAQFEREVTGERIRDKIAASKAKGMWMGGVVPLGYDVRDRKLVVNEAEANTVRFIFGRYAELGSTGELAAELGARGIRTKRRVLSNGDVYGDKPFMRGALAHLLQNRTYIGEVTHNRKFYPGEHHAIVDRELWDRVQALLSGNRKARISGARSESSSLLAGMLRDGHGRNMTPSHATRGLRRYRYYVSRIDESEGAPDLRPWRIPAGEIEPLVIRRLKKLLESGCGELGELAAQLGSEQRDLLAQRSWALGGSFEALASLEQRELLLAISSDLVIREDEIRFSFAPAALMGHLLQQSGFQRDRRTCERIEMRIPAVIKRRGQELRLVLPASDHDAPSRRDPKLIALIAKAHGAAAALMEGSGEIKAGSDRYHLMRMARLRYLAPDISTMIMDGRQPTSLTARHLLRIGELPLCWKQQRELLGFV